MTLRWRTHMRLQLWHSAAWDPCSGSISLLHDRCVQESRSVWVLIDTIIVLVANRSWMKKKQLYLPCNCFHLIQLHKQQRPCRCTLKAYRLIRRTDNHRALTNNWHLAFLPLHIHISARKKGGPKWSFWRESTFIFVLFYVDEMEELKSRKFSKILMRFPSPSR